MINVERIQRLIDEIEVMAAEAHLSGDHELLPHYQQAINGLQDTIGEAANIMMRGCDVVATQLTEEEFTRYFLAAVGRSDLIEGLN